MNEAIGVAVYLVLALAVAVGIRAAFLSAKPRSTAGSGRKPDSVAARVQASPAPVAKAVEKARRSNPSLQRRHAPTRAIPQDHALPWIIPTALVPAATYNDNKKAAMTVEELAERLAAIESRLSRISGVAAR